MLVERYDPWELEILTEIKVKDDRNPLLIIGQKNVVISIDTWELLNKPNYLRFLYGKCKFDPDSSDSPEPVIIIKKSSNSRCYPLKAREGFPSKISNIELARSIKRLIKDAYINVPVIGKYHEPTRSVVFFPLRPFVRG